MGWGFLGRLGDKIVSGVKRVGHKVGEVASAVGKKVEQGAKWAVDHAGDIKNVAGKVEKIAGVVGKAATSALPFTAEIPIVGEVVGGVAGLAKGVEAGARGVGKVAGMVERGKQAYDTASKFLD